MPDGSWQTNKHAVFWLPARRGQYAGTVTTDVFSGCRLMDDWFIQLREFQGKLCCYPAFGSVFAERLSNLCPSQPNEDHNERGKHRAEKRQRTYRQSHVVCSTAEEVAATADQPCPTALPLSRVSFRSVIQEEKELRKKRGIADIGLRYRNSAFGG